MRNFQLRLVLLIVCCAVLTACWSTPANTNTASNTNSANAAPVVNGNTQGPSAPSNPANTASSAGYPQDTRDAFLKSCESAGSKRPFCVCVLEKIEAKYSFEEFKAVEDAMMADETPADFVKFTEKVRSECLK